MSITWIIARRIMASADRVLFSRSTVRRRHLLTGLRTVNPVVRRATDCEIASRVWKRCRGQMIDPHGHDEEGQADNDQA